MVVTNYYKYSCYDTVSYVKKNFTLILHNIRSVYNVGAIFRTADAVGISKIYLSGYTPTPVDRFNQPRADFHKCALGAEKTVVWEYKKTVGPIIRLLKREGFEIVALEQDERSIDYKKFKPKNKTALFLGTETTGISKSLLNQCDSIIELPMKGKKESLNVSVSAGIALYRLFDR